MQMPMQTEPYPPFFSKGSKKDGQKGFDLDLGDRRRGRPGTTGGDQGTWVLLVDELILQLVAGKHNPCLFFNL